MANNAGIGWAAAQLRQIEDMALHFADNMHFTGLTIKLQRQHLITMNQLHILHFSAHPSDAFGLFRAQVKRET